MSKRVRVSMAAGEALAVVSASACQGLDEEGAEPADAPEEAANAKAPDHEPVTGKVAEGFDGAWGLNFLSGTEQLVVTEL